jgi:hypothetical protein
MSNIRHVVYMFCNRNKLIGIWHGAQAMIQHSDLHDHDHDVPVFTLRNCISWSNYTIFMTFSAFDVFMIYDKIIDIQDSYSYLGIVFNYNGKFCTARKTLLEQAQQSTYITLGLINGEPCYTTMNYPFTQTQNFHKVVRV